MRQQTASSVRPFPHFRDVSYRFGIQSDGNDPEDRPAGAGSNPIEGEELPYKVELWNPDRTSVETILAVTANGSIGFAAYYAATRDYTDRYVTLRHKNKILSRWNGHHS
jgi:hypothetical protein